MEFLANIINGMSLGSVYAIIALGYTMVYGIAKMLNFAHGDVIMVGAYICFCSMTYLGLPVIAGVVLSIIGCTVLGIVMERLAYKPLRNAPSLNVLITAIGVSYFLQNAALILMGSDPKSFSSIISLPALRLFDGALTISATAVITILVCVVIMVALTLFTTKTKMGKAMRACSEDRDAAQLMGINVNGTISMVFAIGSGLAAIAGVLMCSAYPTLMPTTGSMPGIKDLHGGGARRHRLHPGRRARRHPARRDRDLGARLHLDPARRRRGLRRCSSSCCSSVPPAFSASRLTRRCREEPWESKRSNRRRARRSSPMPSSSSRFWS